MFVTVSACSIPSPSPTTSSPHPPSLLPPPPRTLQDGTSLNVGTELNDFVYGTLATWWVMRRVKFVRHVCMCVRLRKRGLGGLGVADHGTVWHDGLLCGVG